MFVTLIVETPDGSGGISGVVPDFFEPPSSSGTPACPFPSSEGLGKGCSGELRCFLAYLGQHLWRRTKTMGVESSPCSTMTMMGFRSIPLSSDDCGVAMTMIDFKGHRPSDDCRKSPKSPSKRQCRGYLAHLANSQPAPGTFIDDFPQHFDFLGLKRGNLSRRPIAEKHIIAH